MAPKSLIRQLWVLILICASSFADVHLSERSFTFRLQDEPETLDWNRAHTTVESYLLMNLMEGLVTYDSTRPTEVVPALAESWAISSDRKTYTFKIRQGVKWSDGVSLRAQDFVYSWKRLLSPLTAASYSYFLFDIEGAEAFNKGTLFDFSKVGIKALNDSTLEVRLTTPVAHWIYVPAFWVTFPMRQDVIEKYGVGWDSPGKMVTLGPYTLVSHDADSNWILKRNAFYWGPRGNVDRIVATIIKDDAAALKAYDAGILDFLGDLPPAEVKALRARADLQKFPHLKTAYLAFVVDRFPLSNIRLRRAIAMAIDKAKLCSILQGGEEPAGSFVPPGLIGHSKSIGIAFKPEFAKAELRLSGLNSSESPLTLDYVLPDWGKAKMIADFVQSELKRILGIEVLLHPFDNKTYRSQLELHAFPLFDSSWTADYPDADNFLSVFLGGSGNSRTNWQDARFDDAVKKARQNKDSKEQEKIYLSAQKQLLEEDIVVVPLFYEPNLALVRSRVKNLKLNPMDYLYLRNVNVSP